MNILIIYAHPSKKSYTFQILESLVDQLTNHQHTIELSDLYTMNFQSDMTEQEYLREGLGNLDLPIPDDVTIEHHKIENADCIIFLYPVWWSDCPSKLKGWFDRVFSVGYAYGYDGSGNKIRKMKTIKSAHVICTAGYTNEHLNEIGIAQSMNNVMLNDRLGARFENKKMTILGGTLDKEKAKQQHANIISALANTL